MSDKINFSYPSQEILEKFEIGDIGFTEKSTPDTYSRYISWVEQKLGENLTYMVDDRMQRRSSLKDIFPDFQAAIVVLFPYKKFEKGKNNLKVADYVFGFSGQDYHSFLEKRLGEFLKQQISDQTYNYKIVIDTLPVLDRDLAYRSGLGWYGKNSMLIHKKLGSYFIITSVLFDKKLEIVKENNILNYSLSTVREADHCGSCNQCVEACPTQAIDEGQRFINANLCLSAYTIENFNSNKIPPMGHEKVSDIFGCDICQRVCPWNSKVELISNSQLDNNSKNFAELLMLYNNSAQAVIEYLQSMSKREFKRKFKNTPLERTGRDALIKNISDKI